MKEDTKIWLVAGLFVAVQIVLSLILILFLKFPEITGHALLLVVMFYVLWDWASTL